MRRTRRLDLTPLLACALALAACSGEITGGGGQACVDCGPGRGPGAAGPGRGDDGNPGGPLAGAAGRGSSGANAGSGATPPGPGTNIDPNPNSPPGIEGIGWTTRFPRLSHAQWENTVRDLLRLPERPGLTETFAADPDDSRFDTFGERIVSSNLWSDYQRAAEIVAADVARDPQKLARIRPADAPDDPTAFVNELGRRAFRRPLESGETALLVGLFEQGAELLDAAQPYASGAELVIQALLQSVHFLYRVESSTAAVDRKIWLAPYEVATRLSYALWNTMPSDELLDAAEGDELTTREGVEQWTRTMLDDPRAEDTLVAFHSQLLAIAEYGTIAKNARLFPTFTTALQPVLQAEAREFVREVTAVQGGGIEALLTSPFTFVNEQTAAFYGLSGDFGPELQKVELDPAQRAGFLTQIGFLSKYGTQTQSNPILRGVHVSLDFLCSDLPAPPPNIPPLPEIEPDQTNRERVTALTSQSPCNACHDTLINPLGFAFEHYDAIGQWRDQDNGKPVDATSSYTLDGATVSYDGGVELSQLLAQSMTVHRCYSSSWLEYVLGRPPVREEAGSIENIAQVSARSAAGVRDLLTSITALETFRARAEESVSP